MYPLILSFTNNRVSDLSQVIDSNKSTYFGILGQEQLIYWLYNWRQRNFYYYFTISANYWISASHNKIL